jgi:23S rRNA (adenine2503-C2)-methyltransferase
MPGVFKRYDSSDGNIWKYVFKFPHAIAEAILYRYEGVNKRTVMCISVQSGCPVGCTFCGTGKKFIRNLSSTEIIFQVESIIKDMDQEIDGSRFQIMFMSMGEPFLNFNHVGGAIYDFQHMFPSAELLISTMAPRVGVETYEKFTQMSEVHDKIGLQFSIHEASDERRDILIPYKNKLSIREIRDIGITWKNRTGRPVYINYCLSGDNHEPEHIDRLKDLFSPAVFNFTFSVICSADETMKDAGYRNMDVITEVTNKFSADGYNVRIFDPAGQDDIGGGCGQLWHVQNWMKTKEF